MKNTNCLLLRRWAILLLLAIWLMGFRCGERGKTGLAVENVSGKTIHIVVKYGGVGEEMDIPDQGRALVLWDFLDERLQSQPLREDLASLTVTDKGGRNEVFSREQVVSQAKWDKKIRVWVLTIPPQNAVAR
jgi:hypothetical protein